MAREAARVSLNEQTKTAQFVQNVKEFKPTVFASDVKDFVAADFARFKAGQETHTKIAAKAVYTHTYNAVSNATPRQMGEFLGGGIADTALFGGVTKGFTLVKGAVTSGAKVAVNAAAKPIMSIGQKVLTSSSNFLGFNDAKAFKPAYNAATNPPISAGRKVEGLLFSGGGGGNLECGGRSAVNFNQNSVKALKNFGLTEDQIINLSKGKQVVFEDHATKFPTATIFKVESNTLKAGIWDIIADKPGALKSFKERSIDLAKAMGCDKIEFFGADIKNDRLLNILKSRYGFSNGDPIIINEFGFNNLEVATVRKTVNLNLTSEFSKLMSRLD